MSELPRPGRSGRSTSPLLQLVEQPARLTETKLIEDNEFKSVKAPPKDPKIRKVRKNYMDKAFYESADQTLDVQNVFKCLRSQEK